MEWFILLAQCVYTAYVHVFPLSPRLDTVVGPSPRPFSRRVKTFLSPSQYLYCSQAKRKQSAPGLDYPALSCQLTLTLLIRCWSHTWVCKSCELWWKPLFDLPWASRSHKPKYQVWCVTQVWQVNLQVQGAQSLDYTHSFTRNHSTKFSYEVFLILASLFCYMWHLKLCCNLNRATSRTSFDILPTDFFFCQPNPSNREEKRKDIKSMSYQNIILRARSRGGERVPLIWSISVSTLAGPTLNKWSRSTLPPALRYIYRINKRNLSSGLLYLCLI